MGKFVKKRKSAAAREPENIKRLKSTILQFNKDHDSDWEKLHSVEGETELKKGSKITRKQRRKDERKLKKMRIHAFKQSKPVPTQESMDQEKKEAIEQDRTRKAKNSKRNKRREKKNTVKDTKKEEESTRVQGLIEANRREDKMIRQLEKQLKMNRRKDKTKLPKSFHNDGLDYLLDVADPERVKLLYDGQKDIADLDMSSSDNDESGMEEEDGDIGDGDHDPDDSDGSPRFDPNPMLDPKKIRSILKDTLAKSKKKQDEKAVKFDSDEISKAKKVKLKKIKSPASEEEILDSGDSDVENISDSESGEHVDSDEDHVDSDEEHVDGDSSADEEAGALQVATRRPGLKEDIYGRLRDAEGHVVAAPQESAHTYIPPGKRAQMATDGDGKKKLQLERMRKQLKGLINRLSESTLQSSGAQIEALFREHSRAELSAVLTDEILRACVGPSLIPERLVAEHMLLIAILHGNVGSEIGAYFIQTWAQRFEAQFTADPPSPGKELDNLLLCAASLFNFQVIDGVLLLDMTRRFVERFSEKDIELLLLLLKVAGLGLRRDAAVELKTLIVEIQERASNVDVSQFEDQSRVRFMIEVLLAVRNNNMRKIPNYDPTYTEHLRKLLRNWLHGGRASDGALHISMQELLQAESKGRWWLVGSAWGGQGLKENQSQLTDAHAPLKSGNVTANVSGHILELARKQRMNTDVRKNIFCIIMTSEDFVDAFEKLLRLGLKQQQEREIVHVTLDIAQQQIDYNPFYTLLAQKLAEYNRRFQMTVQFSIWDRLKEISVAKESQSSHLAKLLTHLIASKALSLSVFKVVEFGELDKARVRFMKAILNGLLIDQPEYVIQEVFSRVAPIPKLRVLREGLRLFMSHFLLRGKPLGEGHNLLHSRVNLAEKALTSGDNQMRM